MEKPTCVILRRRLNGYIYNNTTGAEEELGTWNDSRMAECGVPLTNEKGNYYQAPFPEGCDDGVWDAFYFVQLGAERSITDRLISLEKFINGAASIEERCMLAAGGSAGRTIYATIRLQADAGIWNAGNEAIEEIGDWDNSRLAECAYDMDDKGGGYYTKPFPSACATAGTYHILYNDKLGSEYDITDRLIGRDKVLWFGTTVSDEIVPTGSRGMAMVNLRNLVAECESWQAWTGAADAEAAKAFLYVAAYYIPKDTELVKPLGVICRTENDKNEAIAVDSDTVGGDLELRLEDKIPIDFKEQPGNAELYFLNMVEAVLREMWTLSRQPGKIGINSITLIEGPGLYEETAGNFVNGIRLMINWGISS